MFFAVNRNKVLLNSLAVYFIHLSSRSNNSLLLCTFNMKTNFTVIKITLDTLSIVNITELTKKTFIDARLGFTNIIVKFIVVAWWIPHYTCNMSPLVCPIFDSFHNSFKFWAKLTFDFSRRNLLTDNNLASFAIPFTLFSLVFNQISSIALLMDTM